MEVSHEEALKVYADSLETHIGDMLKSSHRLRTILESDMAKAVFVPREWTGIKGFPKLELKFKPNFPESHRIRSRPINPKLYEHAKKEFDRLIKLVKLIKSMKDKRKRRKKRRQLKKFMESNKSVSDHMMGSSFYHNNLHSNNLISEALRISNTANDNSSKNNLLQDNVNKIINNQQEFMNKANQYVIDNDNRLNDIDKRLKKSTPEQINDMYDSNDVHNSNNMSVYEELPEPVVDVDVNDSNDVPVSNAPLHSQTLSATPWRNFMQQTVEKIMKRSSIKPFSPHLSYGSEEQTSSDGSEETPPESQEEKEEEKMYDPNATNITNIDNEDMLTVLDEVMPETKYNSTKAKIQRKYKVYKELCIKKKITPIDYTGFSVTRSEIMKIKIKRWMMK